MTEGISLCPGFTLEWSLGRAWYCRRAFLAVREAKFAVDYDPEIIFYVFLPLAILGSDWRAALAYSHPASFFR